MILIPEISTVLILVPRTGSGSLRRAVLREYPEAMQIYRHMEADGIPYGYDTWRRVGVVRHPIDRMWSLYRFLGKFGGGQHDPAFVAALRNSVDRPFGDWLIHNEIVFTSPYDRANRGRFWPGYACNHPIPENRKSQAVYIRPDLGTEYWNFEHLDQLAASLGVTIQERENATTHDPAPALEQEAEAYARSVFAWDFSVTGAAQCRAASR